MADGWLVDGWLVSLCLYLPVGSKALRRNTNSSSFMLTITFLDLLVFAPLYVCTCLCLRALCVITFM